MVELLTAEPADRVCFGPFEVSVGLRELRRDGRLVKIGERSMALLLALLAAPGQPVSKHRLIQAIWGDRVVEDSNLSVQIAALRRQLGAGGEDFAGRSAFIRTVPGLGYVFAAPVEPRDAVEAKPAGAKQAGPPSIATTWLAEPLTHLIGRDKERRALAQLLSTSRLVTLAGMGGVGKTRLAMRLWRELVSDFVDGITLVDLAPLSEAKQVEEAVAAALGVSGNTVEAADAIFGLLRNRRHLLILDNAEHLSGPVSRLMGQVLARCTRVSVLVTSRESLGLPGEVVYRLSPLDVPPEGLELTAEEALGYDSVRLLVNRAQAAFPDFVLADAMADAAADVCRRLDGIALAIEMAVPRLEVLSLRQLADRAKDRFGAIAPQRHDVLPRQRTLRAMFDWSWELLAEREQRLLQLLAIPAAGMTLEVLETLTSADRRSGSAKSDDLLERLTRLAQSSLVAVTGPRQDREGEPRYRLLETTRQYALELLPREQRIALTRLHAQAVAALFEQAEAEWPVTHSAAWLTRYGPDTDNLRAAMQWAFSRPQESDLAQRLAAASLVVWWELPGLPLREARWWFALGLAAVGPQTPPRVEARLLLGHSWTDTLDSDIENYSAVARAIVLFRATPDPVGLGAALWRAAGTVMFRDHVPSAHALLQEAFSVLGTGGRSKWLALCRIREADLLQEKGDLVPALERYDDALGTMRTLGYNYGLMVCGSNRSYTLFELGRHGDAIAALRALWLELPPGLRQPLLSLLSTMLAASGANAEARALALEGLDGTITAGMGATLARSIETLALLVARSGNHAAAARLTGFALTRHAPSRVRLGPRRVVFERLQTILAAALDAPVLARLETDGAAWTEMEAMAAAMKACREG